MLNHFRDTYIERQPGETPNDRNDRAIRVASKWYDSHLNQNQSKLNKSTKIRTILLTNDEANRTKGQKEGIVTASVLQYVKGLTEFPYLIDKISYRNTDNDAIEKKEIFPPHLTPTEIHDGIKSGDLVQGAFQISRDNYLEGSVNVESFEKSVIIIVVFVVAQHLIKISPHRF